MAAPAITGAPGGGPSGDVDSVVDCVPASGEADGLVDPGVAVWPSESVIGDEVVSSDMLVSLDCAAIPGCPRPSLASALGVVCGLDEMSVSVVADCWLVSAA